MAETFFCHLCEKQQSLDTSVFAADCRGNTHAKCPTCVVFYSDSIALKRAIFYHFKEGDKVVVV